MKKAPIIHRRHRTRTACVFKGQRSVREWHSKSWHQIKCQRRTIAATASEPDTPPADAPRPPSGRRPRPGTFVSSSDHWFNVLKIFFPQGCLWVADEWNLLLTGLIHWFVFHSDDLLLSGSLRSDLNCSQKTTPLNDCRSLIFNGILTVKIPIDSSLNSLSNVFCK
jgi:hypothetical protein